jgi:hypothetical protein
LAVRPFVTDDARVVGYHVLQLESSVKADKNVVANLNLFAFGPTENLVLFPRLLPLMMPKVMSVMLSRVKERIPMPGWMGEQMPELMPEVMDQLMPHMIADVVPLMAQPMIPFLTNRN